MGWDDYQFLMNVPKKDGGVNTSIIVNWREGEVKGDEPLLLH
jgi:hypothetical protein